ncbi:hypothetical protein BOTCAL_0772g00040 [Botryotinia calthae]|uniref:Uncharacterized protein n=1 Tax=Botryotinia calthae TaxID=38488 RepID=A0A4Y8CH33_9HELO|nr:hypothetical protein BOTCAL_0772g00040 [Botryotinia calthae]
MTSTKIVLLTGMLLAATLSTATTYGFLSNSQYEIVLLTGMLLTTGFATATTYGFLSNSQYKIVLLTGILLATGFSTATTYGFLSNSQYEIILLIGMRLTTGFATATTYGFLRNSHYMILRFLRFPTIFLFPATIYFIMELSNGEKLEIVKIIITCFESFDAQKFVEFLTQIPLLMWLFALSVVWSCAIYGIATSFFKENEHAAKSTSAIVQSLQTVNIPAIVQSLQTVNIPAILHRIATYLFLSVGIVLLIGSILFLEGKQQWLLAFIAIILAAPVSYWFQHITTI